MDRKIVIYCSTKKDQDADAVKTKLTLDYSNCTQDDINAMADDSAVIKWQNGRRRMKDAAIPTEATYTVPRPGTKSVVTLTPFEMLCTMFGKEKVIDMVNLAGGNVDTVINKFKELMTVVIEEKEAEQE